MKYKVGDRVKIKSLDWYNKNKNRLYTNMCFVPDLLKYCGKITTIAEVSTIFNVYRMEEDNKKFDWTDEMIEGLVEEEPKNNNDMEEKETLLGWVKETDSLRLVPHKDYEIKHDGDNFYLVKKEKEYPKTYKECCKVMNYCCNPVAAKTTHKEELIRKFQFLLLYRDTYWKIVGDELRLGKSWEPDFTNDNDDDIKYCIGTDRNDIVKHQTNVVNCVLAFPTEEMRDEFYENFKELINECKELL